MGLVEAEHQHHETVLPAGHREDDSRVVQHAGETGRLAGEEGAEGGVPRRAAELVVDGEAGVHGLHHVARSDGVDRVRGDPPGVAERVPRADAVARRLGRAEVPGWRSGRRRRLGDERLHRRFPRGSNPVEARPGCGRRGPLRARRQGRESHVAEGDDDRLPTSPAPRGPRNSSILRSSTAARSIASTSGRGWRSASGGGSGASAPPVTPGAAAARSATARATAHPSLRIVLSFYRLLGPERPTAAGGRLRYSHPTLARSMTTGSAGR